MSQGAVPYFGDHHNHANTYPLFPYALTFNRQRMAMKIAAKKSAEGYQLSDDRCEFCEMQLFAMNGNVTCKVCPALQKLVQMKHNGVGDQREVDDARETTEIVGVDTESRDSEVVDNDDTSKSFHNATDDTAVSLPMKVSP